MTAQMGEEVVKTKDSAPVELTISCELPFHSNH